MLHNTARGLADRLARFAATLAIAAAAIIAVLAPSGCTPKPAETGPALWRLADEDSEIWLFGTVHVLPPKMEWKTPRIEAALQAADSIYFETPVDSAGQSDISALVQRFGFNAPGIMLSDQLSEEDSARLKRVAKAVHLDIDVLERERPWLAAIQLSLAFVVSKGQDANSGVERVLNAEAVQAGKRRAYFETGEQQIRFFADLSPEVEQAFLSVSLRQIEEDHSMLDEMDAAWLRGDVKKLADLLNGMIVEAGPEVYAALITDRNARWAAQIEQMMKGSGKTFIAVGAAHLVGEDSVVAILRRHGYQVDGP